MTTREFAGYSIIRNLAGGGLTRLYVARDAQQNRVVIRQLTEDSARNRHIKKNFFHSAEILSKLRHPNIIRFISAGYQDKIPFMVLDYVESRTLRELILQRDALLANNVLSFMRQLAAALYYIHSNHYLHLDFKPENILVANDGHVYVIDFDLAMRIPRWWWNRKIRQLPGTPSYMAPEMQKERLVDERSDIYSFGVTCYEMVTYHKPFEADKIEKARADQLDPNVPPIKPRQHNSAIPAALESLILKCLAKKPEDRYPSMSLVIRDLEAMI